MLSCRSNSLGSGCMEVKVVPQQRFTRYTCWWKSEVKPASVFVVQAKHTHTYEENLFSNVTFHCIGCAYQMGELQQGWSISAEWFSSPCLLCYSLHVPRYDFIREACICNCVCTFLIWRLQYTADVSHLNWKCSNIVLTTCSSSISMLFIFHNKQLVPWLCRVNRGDCAVSFIWFQDYCTRLLYKIIVGFLMLIHKTFFILSSWPLNR